MRITPEREQHNQDERERLGLSEGQYYRFKFLIENTKIKNLPDDLKEFRHERTGLTFNSLYIDFDLSCEVVAEYIKNNPRI